MSKKTEFKSDLEKIVRIFFLCKESYLVLRELYKTVDNTDYIINLKFKGPFFTLTKVNYWRIIALQLSKIYVERERFNIIKLLEKCKKGGYFASINLNQDFIEEQLYMISQKQKYIEHIKLQRDKIFAHEDADNAELANDLTLDETKDLIDLCQNILFKMYGEVYETHFDFEMRSSAVDNLKKILTSLNEREIQKEMEEKRILDEYKKLRNQ